MLLSLGDKICTQTHVMANHVQNCQLAWDDPPALEGFL